MTTVREAIEYFKRAYKDKNEHIALIIWSQEDIIGRAKERRLKITIHEAQEIVDAMENNHDASMGITLNDIDDYLDDLVIKRKEEKEKKENWKIA